MIFSMLYMIFIIFWTVMIVGILGYALYKYKRAPKVTEIPKDNYEKHDKLKIYLAGSIFTYGDYLRNIEWANKIREAIPNVDLYSPVENTAINGVEGKKKFAGSKEIIKADNARLDQADILIACIDGRDIEGTCAEIGKFHEKIARGDHKYIVGICTDTRQMYLTHSIEKDKGGASALGEQQYSYQNIYVTGLIKDGGVLVATIEEVINYIKSKLGEFIDTRPNEETIDTLKDYYFSQKITKLKYVKKIHYNEALEKEEERIMFVLSSSNSKSFGNKFDFKLGNDFNLVNMLEENKVYYLKSLLETINSKKK